MPSFKQTIIDALEKKYEAQMSKAEANLKVLLENPVGVGDHPDIVETVDKEMQKITKAKEMLDELSNWRTQMWLSAIKLAVSTGSKIYANKQRQKEAMSQAALLTAEKMARGETEYQGKLLEARQNDYKDEVVLFILTLPILVLAYGVFSDDAEAMAKINLFFEHFQALPTWFTNLWILVVASIFGIKGTQIFRNGKK